MGPQILQRIRRRYSIVVLLAPDPDPDSPVIVKRYSPPGTQYTSCGFRNLQEGLDYMDELDTEEEASWRREAQSRYMKRQQINGS